MALIASTDDQPTLLAGAIEFSPLDIAMIIAVLAGAFVIVTSPGWVALAVTLAKRSRANGSRPWVGAVAGAGTGLVVSAVVAAVVGWLLGVTGSVGMLVAVALAWLTCWALAAGVSRRPAVPQPTVRPDDSSWAGGGWGR